MSTDKEDYDDAFNDGYSIGKGEVLDKLHVINNRIELDGYDNVSKQDMRFAIKTIVEYFINKEIGQVGSDDERA